MSNNRDTFTSGLGVLAATLGSAVGLGNIWKFPYLTGMNGGAAFLVIYLLSTLLVGLPIMIAEISLGRSGRASAVGVFKKLCPGNRFWPLLGMAGALGAFLILAFYTEVAGWVFAYVFKSVTGGLKSTNPISVTLTFNKLVTNPMQALLWQWIVLASVASIIVMGVTKGIERTTKKLMPLLFILLLAVAIRGLTLPGAAQGLAFLFKPDFSKITGPVILVAMGLAFFKLSIGMGTMMTYGSYFRDEQNIPKTALSVMVADLTVSMLAGITIFPAVFAFGFRPDAGPSLLFITIPAVFSSMPLGWLVMTVFFLLTAVAATGAMISIMEVPVAYLCEAQNWSRRKSTLVTMFLLMLAGAPAALSSSLTSSFKIAGMNMFDIYDFLTSNLIMPVSGLLICIFVVWVWGKDAVKKALSNHGKHGGAGEQVINSFFFLAKWITPVLVLLILMRGLHLF